METKDRISVALYKKVITKDGETLIREYIKRLSENNVPIIYNLRHLRKILKIKKNEQDILFGKERDKCYRVFNIKKRNGGTRVIEAPDDRLKSIQSWIKESILEKVHISAYAKGFKKETNIVDNARAHVGKELVYNIDIKDFFPSIRYAQVFRIFMYLGYNKQVSHLLTKLCTNSNDVLPQGSPASPIISNIVCLKLDARLSKLAECYNASYSRYADDITFSGVAGIKNMSEITEKIVNEEGFSLNRDKIRYQFHHQRQEVTGVIVNDKLSVHPKIIKEIENAIYYCKKYGVDSHMQYIKCDKSYYKEHLYGLAYFIKMIDTDAGKRYLHDLDEVLWAY